MQCRIFSNAHRMSRSNPGKKKQRAAKQTLLMYGEGAAEEAFLKYLKSHYARDTGVAITIRNGKGGDPESIVRNAVREPGAFDRCVVVLDNDKPEQEMRAARQIADSSNIVLVEQAPCLESILLSILNNGTSYERRPSAWCKNEFESRYIEKKRRRDVRAYQDVFPKELLDTRRTQVDTLNVLITFMEGQ